MARNILLLLLLFSTFLRAQEVKPIVSDDYLSLVRRDSVAQYLRMDTSNSIRSSTIKLLKAYSGSGVRKLRIKNGELVVLPAVHRTLTFSGSYTAGFELKKANQQPQIQNSYVQGESQNGNLVWKGPETGELFSFGPLVSSLYLDGTLYPYDKNGRWAPAPQNGSKGSPYNNSLLQTGSRLMQNMSMQSEYLKNGRSVLKASVSLGHSGEQLVIPDNKNTTLDLRSSVQATVNRITFTASFNSFHTVMSNANRNGFLNRVYESSLLTPISFENNQGSTMDNGQRSYSAEGDNPYFLLQHNLNSYEQSTKNGSFMLVKKGGRFQFGLRQSLEHTLQNDHEGYVAGTAFFPNGAQLVRLADGNNYFLQGNTAYDIHYKGSDLRSTLSTNYVFTTDRYDIHYAPGLQYVYKRAAHNAAIGYNTTYDGYQLQTGLKVENKIYASATTTSNFFLPSAAGFIRYRDLLDQRLTLKLTGSYQASNSELPLSAAYSSASLLQYNTSQALEYFPVQEVSGFSGLLPIHHKEATAKLEINYGYHFVLSGEVFRRKISNDVFPVIEGNELNLKNIADHRNKGFEIEAGWNTNKRDLSLNNTISFSGYNDKVLETAPGYDHTPIAGFNNVHKTVIKGAPLGVIVGSRFQRDERGRLVIGEDGFPLASATPGIIGDPTPDFIMKQCNSIRWKRWQFILNWEWRKGGDVWNGTQGVLDYYGRSQTSGDLRNTVNYVFDGVTTSGHINSKPVAFYDPALPVQQNLWTRNGYGGIDEAYIQKGDYIRITNMTLSYKITNRSVFQSMMLSLYANNLFIWTAYKGADPNQLLFDQANSGGLDYFNLPSVKSFGFSASLQF